MEKLLLTFIAEVSNIAENLLELLETDTSDFLRDELIKHNNTLFYLYGGLESYCNIIWHDFEGYERYGRTCDLLNVLDSDTFYRCENLVIWSNSDFKKLSKEVLDNE